MTNILKSKALGLAGMIIALASPCSATLLSFTTTDTTGASIATSNTGSTATVTTLSNVAFTSLSLLPGTTYSLLGTGSVTDVFLSYNSTTDVLSLKAGSVGLTGIFSNITAGTTLLTINLSSALTANVGSGSGASFSLNTPSVSSVTGNSTFLADLGLSSVLSFSSVGVSGQESGTSKTYSLTSDGLAVNATPAATPEPVTFVLIGSGLAAVGAFRRKKLAVK